MCVILEINPGAKLPADKLERACDINPDGYGIAYSDGRELRIFRSLEKNTPAKVQQVLDTLTKHRVFVHLRFATVGAVNLENNHPFVLLQNRRKQAQIGMMHNGTLHRYSPSTDKVLSDTHMFASTMVGPLTERISAFAKSNYVLTDPLFQKIIANEVGLSVLVLFDKWGHTLKFNEDKGKQFDGWWASNDYSFNDQHYRSSASTTNTFTNQSSTSTSTGHGIWRNRAASNDTTTGRNPRRTALPWQEDTFNINMSSWEQELNQSGNNVLPFATTPPHDLKVCPPYCDKGHLRLKYETQAIGQRIKEKHMPTTQTVQELAEGRNLKIRRTSFIEQAGLESITQVGNLAADDLEKLMKEYPLAMAQLILDLYGEYITQKVTNTQQAKTITDLQARQV